MAARSSLYSSVVGMLINLLYHDIATAGNEDDSGFPGPEAARYKLTPTEFETHLNQVGAASNGLPLCTIDSTRQAISGADAWTISFDDGGLSAITEIAERLEVRGWRGWFFIATDFIGKPSFCDPDQIRQLFQRGHVIGSHSCSHPEKISSCSWEQLIDEWTRSCRILSDLIQEPVTSASVPGGFYSTAVARAASQAGVKILFNSEPTTRAFAVDGMTVLGRYNVYRGMNAADARSLMTSPARRWRQAAFWNLKKAAKVMAGPMYKFVRRKVLSHSYGDTRAGQ